MRGLTLRDAAMVGPKTNRLIAAFMADSPSVFQLFDDPSGTTAQDQTANNRDGTYVGSPTLGATGIAGLAATSFDGSNDEVTIAANSAYWPSGSQGVTVEIWYKGTDTGNDTVLSAPALVAANEDGSNKRWGIFLNAAGKACAFTKTSYIITGPGTGAAINDNAWHQVVLTIAVTTFFTELFVDGASVATNTTVSDAGTGSPIIRVGRHFRSSGDQYVGGTMTAFAVFPSVLSSTRIAAHRTTGT